MAVDIYSLGMVLWELGTGEIPFKTARNQMIIIGWIMKREKEEIPKTCPDGFRELIESCWDKAESRPSAEKVAAQLKILLVEEEYKSHISSSISEVSSTSTLSTEMGLITSTPGTLFHSGGQIPLHQRLQIPTSSIRPTRVG